MTRSRGILSATAVVTVVLVILVAVPRPGVTGPDDGAAPEAGLADGLPVIGVSRALAVASTFAENDPVAVEGWYSTGFGHSCPAPLDPRQNALLAMYCVRGETVLTEVEEAAVRVARTATGDMTSVEQESVPLRGAHLDPLLDWFATDLPITPDAVDPWIPQPVVAVGHFRDHRAADCLPAELEACLATFVIDHLPVVRGVEQGPILRADPGMGAATWTPEVIDAGARRELGQDARILSVAALRGRDVTELDDRVPGLDPLAVVWYVRAIDRGADGTSAPRLVSLAFDDVGPALVWRSP